MAAVTEARVAGLLEHLGSLRAEMAKVIVGQEEAVAQLLTALLAGGHCLLEGVPGLGKTLMVRTLADSLHLSFRRIQFTPDLMPTDILGTEMLEEDHGTGQRVFRFARGPIFANVVLADEINRTPPKTQAALLEAMQERAVTFAGDTHQLQRPFFVLATQNPIEQAGTYPLPEAQLDRFLFHVRMEYPGEDEEVSILRRTTGVRSAAAEAVLAGEELRACNSSPARCGRARGCWPTSRAWCGPPGRATAPTRWCGVGALGRRAAGRAGAGARRQGAGAARRPVRDHAGGRPGARGARPPAPRAGQLPRRGRRDGRRHDRRAAPGGRGGPADAA